MYVFMCENKGDDYHYC